MKQSQFEAENVEMCLRIENILDGTASDQRDFPALYRRLCQCLALCRQRGYSPALADHLQALVSRCHRRMYGNAVERSHTLLRWMGVEFPRRVRAEWRLLLLALAAFFGVGLAVGLLVWFQPHWAYSFASPAELATMRSMYQPGNVAIGRHGAQGDVMMFGFYIWNNTSIGFRTFAGGIFGGIPALLSVASNGIQLGVVGAWLSKDPDTVNTFWSFVVTHSSFEVTGLLLSAVAGMRMGLALIHPGRSGRMEALYATGREIFPVTVGAALLTVLAAFFEGFWSASTAVPAGVKYAVGALCWSAVILFFTFAGRDKR
ncbi:MAG: stage II sporulation protein M [Massilia sp.]